MLKIDLFLILSISLFTAKIIEKKIPFTKFKQQSN